MFQRALVTMGRHVELSTCRLLISVRAGDLQNDQEFSIMDRRENLNSRTPFLMERSLYSRREHSTFYLASFWPNWYDISCVLRAACHLTDYVDQTLCLPKEFSWSEFEDASRLDLLQSVFESFGFGSFSHVLVTYSYSSNPTGSLTVPENQSPSTQSLYEIPPPVQTFFLNWMALEFWSDKLSRNVVMQLQTYAA